MSVLANGQPGPRFELPRYLINKIPPQVGALASLAIVSLALSVVYRTLQDIQLSDVLEQLQSLPLVSVLLALLVTATSYFVSMGYDVLALHHINRSLPYPRVALASFLADAFGSNFGFALVTGGAIRYRMYSDTGLSTQEIAAVTAMYSITASLGVGFLFMLSLLFGGGHVSASAFGLPAGLQQAFGGLMLATMIAYITISMLYPVTIRIKGLALRLPSAGTAILQIALGAIDLMLMGTIIYLLLPADSGTNFFTYIGVFAVALMAGAISHVPGGIGVFEAVMLLGLPQVPPAALLGAIVLFRCIYYLVPLSLAAIVLAIHEVRQQRSHIERARDTVTDQLAAHGPHIMAAIVIMSGVLLLFLCAVPANSDRLALLQSFLPGPVLEAAHMIAGGSGVGLIFLARPLSRRLERAYRYCIVLLTIGVMAVLLKGLAYESAIALAAVLLVISATRLEFQRQGSLFEKGFPAEWASTLLAILAAAIWLGMFAYKHVDYPHEFWWHLLHDNSEFTRFLRTTMAALALASGITVVNLLRLNPVPDVRLADAFDRIRNILKQDRTTSASLALLGDKRFLLNDLGNAFVMYRIKGKSWVALGDPVGALSEREKLIKGFLELCDRYGGWPVFYGVGAEHLPFYTSLGLSILNLGEDACVRTDTFSLRGAERTELRKALEAVRQHGLRLSIVGSTDVPAVIPELKRVSDAWLHHANQAEKSFARGSFNPQYVSNFPCAVVRTGNHIVAFAVLRPSVDKEELALDIVRYDGVAPPGIFAFMVAEVLLQGQPPLWARWLRGDKSQFCWFNLGMVPGVAAQAHELGPLRERLGALPYPQSDHFQDLDSYRCFAKRLAPVWRAKYLVLPGGLDTSRILGDIASLIARVET